jgi:hypothetical protein
LGSPYQGFFLSSTPRGLLHHFKSPEQEVQILGCSHNWNICRRLKMKTTSGVGATNGQQETIPWKNILKLFSLPLDLQHHITCWNKEKNSVIYSTCKHIIKQIRICNKIENVTF